MRSATVPLILPRLRCCILSKNNHDSLKKYAFCTFSYYRFIDVISFIISLQAQVEVLHLVMVISMILQRSIFVLYSVFQNRHHPINIKYLQKFKRIFKLKKERGLVKVDSKWQSLDPLCILIRIKIQGREITNTNQP